MRHRVEQAEIGGNLGLHGRQHRLPNDPNQPVRLQPPLKHHAEYLALPAPGLELADRARLLQSVDVAPHREHSLIGHAVTGRGTLWDFPPEVTIKSSTSKWIYGSDPVYSPLYGAVIWVLGTTLISGNPAHTASIDFQCSGSAGCSSSIMPYGLWKVSLISVGDLILTGECNLGPANTDADYWFELVSGRDIMVSGNPQETSLACSGSPACDFPDPTDIQHMGGIYAAHESIRISGNPNVFGFLVAEEAIECSTEVSGSMVLDGNPKIFYNCEDPPSPWVNNVPTQRLNWQEVR